MTITIIAQHPMWRAGRQWPQGETRVEEGLSKEALAALETDPNFSVQGAKKAKEAKTKNEGATPMSIFFEQIPTGHEGARAVYRD